MYFTHSRLVTNTKTAVVSVTIAATQLDHVTLCIDVVIVRNASQAKRLSVAINVQDV